MTSIDPSILVRAQAWLDGNIDQKSKDAIIGKAVSKAGHRRNIQREKVEHVAYSNGSNRSIAFPFNTGI